jgi:hypothetical protein
MKMTKLKFWMALPVVAVLCLGLSAKNVQAGAVSHFVGGIVNELEDDDFEIVIDNNQNGVFDVGDLTLGVITIQAFNAPPGVFPSTYNPGATDATITGLFLTEVKAVVTQSGDSPFDSVDHTIIYQGAVGVTGWSALTGLTLPDPVDADTMFIAWDDVTSGALTTTGSLQASIDSFVGTNKVYEFGFADADDDGKGDAGEFWLAHGDAGIDVIGVSLTSIKNIMNLDLLGTFDSAPDLLEHAFLAGDAALQAVALDSGVSFASAQQLQSQGSISGLSGGVWSFKTDTNSYVKPIPEPSSIVLMGIGIAGVGAMGYRRRSQKKAA